MKVKIGETIYDSETEPVMVILSDFDKKNISHMAVDATKYASFPDCFGSADEMRAWMLTPNARTVGPDAGLSRQVPHE